MAQDRARNRALAAYLARVGWSPENLGHHLNRLAATLRLPDRIHTKTPRRWAEAIPPRLRPSVPRDPWPGLVCALLSGRLQEPVTLASLGWLAASGAVYVPADDGLDYPWDARGATASLHEVVEADGMDRRNFLVVTGTSLTAFAEEWLFDPARIAAAVRGWRTDRTVVDDLERVAEARRRLDDAFGGGAAVLRAVRADLRLVIDILNNASYTEEVGRRLYGVAAEFARIAGMLAFDLDQQALAQRLWLAGLRAAHLSRDRAVGANILAAMSQQARYVDPQDGVRLAEAALDGAGRLTPAVAARVHGQLSAAAACVGDRSAADLARGRMFELTAAIDREAEPPWIYWWSEAEAYYHAGQSAMALQRHGEAEVHFRRAVARVDPAYPRDRAKWLPRLAMARVHLGELDSACRAATEAAALSRRLGSERVRTRLREFRTAVEPHATVPVVREFHVKLNDLLRA